MEVRRSDATRILNDHEKRVRTLERAPRGSGIYVDDRILTEPSANVDFGSFPSDVAILELTWRAVITGSSGNMRLAFNGDYPAFGVTTYSWRYSGSIADSGEEDGSGALLVPVDSDVPVWGRIRFPGFTTDSNNFTDGPHYLGEVAVGGYDADTPTRVPDTAQCAGWRGDDDQSPLTQITVFVDGDGNEWDIDSRFTLTGYGVV